jgi:hypothetical protein
VRASREVILKLPTQLSFCSECATENRTLRTTKSSAELWQQAWSQNTRAEGNWLLARIGGSAGLSCYRSAFCRSPKVSPR